MEERIKALEDRVDSLTKSLLQLQKNQTPITAKAESAESGVKAITPTTFTKTAYIDDTEVVFENVPSGNVSLYMTDAYGENVDCSWARVNGDIIVTFEKRTSLATVNISIL